MGSQPSSTTPAEPLVGRAREFAELRAGLEEARGGRGRLFLISGDAGVGKTRLCAEVAEAGSREGAGVAWARSWPGAGAPPYWLWSQILQGIAREIDADKLTRLLGSSAGDVLHIAPEVGERIISSTAVRQGVADDLSNAPSEHARFRLFDTVSGFVRRASEDGSWVLIFDDLQWADVPSLRLLEFFARGVADVSGLLVCAYRDVEARSDDERSAALGRLARLGTILPLGGLAQADLKLFAERRFGVAIPEKAARIVHEATAGNPLYADEVLRLLLDHRGTDVARITLDVPAGVRETIRERIAFLPEGSEDILRIASVVGSRFGLPLLEQVSGLERRSLLEVLGPALQVRLLDQVGPGAYAFAHALVRETLYSGIPPAERPALHLRVGEAMEGLWANDVEPHLEELAHQFVQGSAAGGAAKAVTYAQGAGERAMTKLAYEEAAWHLACALEVLGLETPDARHRCELLLGLADARARMESWDAAREGYEEAAGLGSRLGDGELVARAALGIGGKWSEVGRTDRKLVGLLEQALELLGPRDSAVRARLLARLGMELHWSAPPSERLTLCRRAVEMARRVGDRRALAFVLSATHFALAGIGDVEEHVAAAREMIRLAEEASDLELALEGHGWLVADLLEKGDIQHADAAIGSYERIAHRLRRPSELWGAVVTRATRAQIDGRFDDAQRLATEAFSLAQQADTANGARVFGVQMATILTELGRAAELILPAQALIEQQADIPGWRCALANLCAEADRVSEAREEFERLSSAGFGDLFQDLTWLPSVTSLARVCAYLEDGERAGVLYDLLRPFAGRITVIGYHVACTGPVDHELGLLAGVLGRFEEAEAHFSDAVRHSEDMGARPFTARVKLGWARTLRARDDRLGDRGRDLAGQALATARELGMASIVDRASALLAEPDGAR